MVDGTADLRVVEVPARKVSIRPPQTRPRLQPTHKLVVNVSPDTLMNPENAQEIKAVRGMKVEGMHKIVGLHIQHVKGSGESVAKIKVKEGMWEQKQGRKVDGGERRKVQVRYKRRMEQKRAAKR